MNRRRIAPILMLLACVSAWLWIGTGCKTTTAYKPVAAMETTVDAAMRAWADYVVWAERKGVDAQSLASRQDAVRSAHAHYREAMAAMYAARAAYDRDPDAEAPQWQRAIAAASAASSKVITLIESFIH